MLNKNLFLIISVSLILSFTVIIIFSCSTKQVINVAENGDISCNVEIKLTRMFTSYIDDLSEAAGTGEKIESYFDVNQIKESFSSLEGISLEKISDSSKPELKLSFSVKNNAQGIKSSAAGEIFSFTENNGIKKISFNLDRKNYEKLNKAFAFDDNPVLAGLTPQVDNPYSEEEYFELVDYVFGEYAASLGSSEQDSGGNPSAKTLTPGKIISECFVDVEVNVKGKVMRADGGKISGSRANFKIPVIRFLTLSDPVFLEVEYK
ncbi:MAG: hypothetical protein RBT69_12850 [Spirochaetia bacterium]|jgi:hypothetical protein|nr:hypothetical protein [Spirochaetia bacterium]